MEGCIEAKGSNDMLSTTEMLEAFFAMLGLFNCLIKKKHPFKLSLD